MPQVEIVIGGRSFEVACQPGEEPFLRAAAEILDVEASALSSQIGRMPEARMLLMAGLMLADKASGLEEQLRSAEAQIHELATREPAAPREVEVPVEVPVEVRVEVPVIPEEVSRVMADLAAEAEALARAVLGVIPERGQGQPA
jgi:cell division protein ZapA